MTVTFLQHTTVVNSAYALASITNSTWRLLASRMTRLAALLVLFGALCALAVLAQPTTLRQFPTYPALAPATHIDAPLPAAVAPHTTMAAHATLLQPPTTGAQAPVQRSALVAAAAPAPVPSSQLAPAAMSTPVAIR